MDKNQRNRRVARDRKFAINSIVLNVLCLASKTPFLIGSLVSLYMDFDDEKAEMVDTIGETIFLIDNASSFFTNLIFNSMFRDELLRIFGHKKFEQESTRSGNNFTHSNRNRFNGGSTYSK